MPSKAVRHSSAGTAHSSVWQREAHSRLVAQVQLLLQLLQHPAANSQALYSARLPGAAAQEQHTAACISVWHISIEGLPVAAALRLAQHPAAYISARHISMASPPDVTAQAQHTAAYSSTRHIFLSTPPDDSAPAQHAAASGDSEHIAFCPGTATPAHTTKYIPGSSPH